LTVSCCVASVLAVIVNRSIPELDRSQIRTHVSYPTMLCK